MNFGQVGGFILMHKEDLRRMAPLWLKYSEDVRFDPDVRFLLCLHILPNLQKFLKSNTSFLEQPLRFRYLSPSFADTCLLIQQCPMTRHVLACPCVQAWKLSGDVYATHPGDKPWISEMYGYSFGAAKANVWHKYHTTAMMYPSYQSVGVHVPCH